MTREENIKRIAEIQKQEADIDSKMEELKAQKESLTSEKESLKNEVLTDLKTSDLLEVEVDGLFANVFHQENIGYTSDADVIKYLKDNGLNQFIKVKTTESLDKTPLKKEIKSNAELAEALGRMTVKTVTEWVVVTETENHTKMLEHIDKNTKK